MFFRSALAGAAALAVFAAVPALAEDFPSKTIEVITHAGAGGGTDVTTRMMLLRTRRELKADMVVANRRGGNGAAAMGYFMTRPDDGHTVLAFTIGHAITVAKGKTNLKVSDMKPLARGTDDPQIFMVNCKQSPYKTGAEMVEAMKADKLKFGTTNAGGIDHITAYVFADKGGLMQPDIVPFSGGGEVATQLVAGSVDVGVLNLSEASAQIDAGDICPLIVLGTARMGPILDAATAQELGIDAVFSTVRGFVTHAGVDDAKAAKLEGAMIKAMNHAVYQGFLDSVGLDSTSVAGADDWSAQIQKMIDDMTPAIKAMGL
ncbi:MAG: tripartite tricarboxylate transporter substrate binding protein [Pseudomonadota bacterium]